MISALQSHRRAYADFLGTQDANLGERLGNTDAVKKLLAEFKLFAQKELLVDVAYVFGRQKPNPAALTLFLPKGRKEYGGATLLTLPALLERVASLSVTYKDDLGGGPSRPRRPAQANLPGRLPIPGRKQGRNAGRQQSRKGPPQSRRSPAKAEFTRSGKAAHRRARHGEGPLRPKGFHAAHQSGPTKSLDSKRARVSRPSKRKPPRQLQQLPERFSFGNSRIG